jgi:hypothetical protein
MLATDVQTFRKLFQGNVKQNPGSGAAREVILN